MSDALMADALIWEALRIDHAAWRLAGLTMVHFLWLGAAVALCGAVVHRTLRRSTPAARYSASLATLLLLAALPAAIAVWIDQLRPEWLASRPLAVDTSTASPTLAPAAPPAAASDAGSATGPVVIDLAELSPEELAQLSRRIEADSIDQQAPAVIAPADTSSQPLDSPPIELIELTAPAVFSWRQWERRLQSAATVLPWLWLTGAPLTFAWLALGLVGSDRLRRCSVPIVDGPAAAALEQLRQAMHLSRRVALSVCDSVVQPVLVGVVQPMILLPPAALAGWSPAELEMVLVHELAHVRRWDNLVNLMQRLIESLLFFHPAVWLVSRQVRRDREECCDAIVVAHTARPQAYAELLLSIAAQGQSTPLVASALARHPLAQRLRRILKLEDEPMLVSRSLLGMIAAAMVVAVALVLSNPWSSSAANDEVDSPETSGNSATDEQSKASADDTRIDLAESDGDSRTNDPVESPPLLEVPLSKETTDNSLDVPPSETLDAEPVDESSAQPEANGLAASWVEEDGTEVYAFAPDAAVRDIAGLVSRLEGESKQISIRQGEDGRAIIRATPAPELSAAQQSYPDAAESLPQTIHMSEDNSRGAIEKIFKVTDWLHAQSMAPLITELEGERFEISTVGLTDESLLQSGWHRIDYQLHTSWSDYLTRFTHKWPQLNIKLGSSRRHGTRGIEERIYASVTAPRRVHEELLKHLASLTKQERDAAATPSDETQSQPPGGPAVASVALGANAAPEEILHAVDQLNARSMQVTITVNKEGQFRLRGEPSVNMRLEPGRRSVTYRVPLDRSREIERWVNHLRRPGDEWRMRPSGSQQMEFSVVANLSTHKALLNVLTGATTAPAVEPSDASASRIDILQPALPFLSLQDQRNADLAYKLLGLELERPDAEELATAKKLGFPGALRLAGLKTHNSLFTSRGDAVGVSDLLVGLHVWPTDSLEAVRTILSRDDLEQLTPLKFFVLRKQRSGGYGGGGPFGPAPSSEGDEGKPYRLATGRISIDPQALMSIRAQQHQARQLETPPPTDLQRPASDLFDPGGRDSPDLDLLDQPAPQPTPDAATPTEDLPPADLRPREVSVAPEPSPTPDLIADDAPQPTPDLLDAPRDVSPPSEPPMVDLATPEIDGVLVVDPAPTRPPLQEPPPGLADASSLDRSSDGAPRDDDSSHGLDPEAQMLLTEINRLQQQIDDAKREMVEIEVAARVAYEESTGGAPLATRVEEQLQNDPAFAVLKKEVDELNRRLNELERSDSDESAEAIQQAQARKKFVEEKMDEIRARRLDKRENLDRRAPEERMRLVLAEKQIRQAATVMRITEYEKRLEETMKRLSQLGSRDRGPRSDDAAPSSVDPLSEQPTPAGDAPRKVYRYNGQSFEQWRSKWRRELNPQRRVEAIHALATFAQVGFADQAAEEILDMAGQYEWERSRLVSIRAVELLDAIKEALSGRQPPVPASVWLPKLMQRYKDRPQNWAPLANALIGSLRTYDKDTRDVVLSLAKETTSEFQHAAIRSLQETWEGEEDFAKVLANVVEFGEVEASRNALHQLVSQLTKEQTALDWRYDEAPASPAVEAIISTLLQSEVAVQNKIRGAIQSLQPPIHAKIARILLSRFGDVKDRHARVAVMRTWANSVNELDASQRASVFKLLQNVIEQDGSRGAKIAAAVAAERVASIKRDGLDSNEPLRQLKFAVGVDPEDKENEAHEKLMDEVRREYRALEVHP